MKSVKTFSNQCVEKVLDSMKFDKYFFSFYKWAATVSVPVLVFSGGLTPLSVLLYPSWCDQMIKALR